jgi:uncharacterized protein
MSIFIYYPKQVRPMKKLFLIIFALLALAASLAAAQIPTINSYVTDNAQVLPLGTKTQLENELRSLEKETNGAQFVIFIENEYPKEYSLEEYTLKIAEANKIGKKVNDNGILLYIAIKDRKYRWEVGYGMESTLNSALLGRISREYFVPNFRNEDYEKGIMEAFDAVKRVLLGSSDADIAAIKGYEDKQLDKTAFVLAIFIMAVFFFMIYLFYRKWLKRRNEWLKSKGKKKNDDFFRGAATGLFWGSLGRGRGGFGGSGGFGGFSGGGGGFGGGGGSGGW